MLEQFHLNDEAKNNIEKEGLLPEGLIRRIEAAYPEYSNFDLKYDTIFTEKNIYSGLRGFREIVDKLKEHGIELNHIKEREFFIEVYRFLATKFFLNCIDWNNYETDPLFHLVFPQPGMIPAEEFKKYEEAKTDEERREVVAAYQRKTNPHDGNQKLNKPWFINDDGEVEILEGSQHKYPPVLLILDKMTQSCFAYCTYCFRHAQVRGDEDMFVQRDIKQIHNYIKKNPKITDILLTGGDAAYMPNERLKEYVLPLIDDPELLHVRTVRIGSRAITYQPELILSDKFNETLELFKKLIDNGIQVVWMAHISTAREILNPGSIAAIKRLRKYGVNIKSQSPIMNHFSLYTDENGKVDIDKSAKNWIDLANILAMLGVGFHAMYFARPTGEHHYFTAPLADISKIFNKIYRSLSSLNRPSRYITMTSSAGKTSLLGTTEINGEKAFVLKFNEARNMKWIDEVYFGEYDENESVIEKLKPFGSDKYFYEDELEEIENELSEVLKTRKLKK
ncbi:MAG: hypothetical protein GXO47_02935 [Chlorobi bacterium]|nr:hypothetical protein [Chlorobiota bacterium]